MIEEEEETMCGDLFVFLSRTASATAISLRCIKVSGRRRVKLSRKLLMELKKKQDESRKC
jgi:hypothetical protein